MFDVKAILFDLDNTLIDRDRALVAWLARQVSTSQCALLAAIDAGGQGSRTEFFAALGVAMGLSPVEARHRLYSEMTDHVTLKSDARELFARLGTRYRLALGSNGSTDLQMRKLRAAGLDDGRFEVIAISQALGCDKPDPRFFTTVLDRLGLAPHEVLMVGDHPLNDITGAQALGMHTCWVRTVQRHRPEIVDQVVDKLTEIDLS